MLKNIPVNILIKIISNGSCQTQNFQGFLNKTDNLMRVTYEEEYENQKVFVAFSMLSNNILRLVKKGAYAYELKLNESEITGFCVNYGGFSVDFKCQTKKVNCKILDNKIEVYAHYFLISQNEKTSNKIYLTISL